MVGNLDTIETASIQADAGMLLPISTGVPLYVDLDGTLIKSDTLWEGFWAALRRHPLACLWACLDLVFRRAELKQRIAQLAMADPAQLPYRMDVLAFLRREAQAGRPLILATAADESIARGVAKHLRLFAQVIASDGETNRKGVRKLEAISKVAGDFVYAGDSTADVTVWKASAGAIVVGGNRKVLRDLSRDGVRVLKYFPAGRQPLRAFMGAIRVHQWPKNLLALLPIFLGHKTLDLSVWASGVLVVLIFCLTASFGYIVNDLLDLEADRQHPTKRNRPFASGDLAIASGFLLLAGLALFDSAACLLVTRLTAFWVGVYLIFSVFYSLYLKTRLLADVVSLAVLHILRVMAGGAATGIAISHWTFAFCLFLFYSLALIKRFGELRSLPNDQRAPTRRGYQKVDLPIVATLGATSGILSVVVFALYISSPEVGNHYSSPAILWLACPLILYWFGRLWILTNRGDVAEDPLLFSLKDKVSYFAGACMALIWLAASISR
jgi:4-hydroxybenzoate polyprenyltransferase/phosphoglycolate phosphatase-like HAD superfamily hydrolase